MSDYELARDIADILTTILCDIPWTLELPKRRVKPCEVLSKVKDRRELYFYYYKLKRNCEVIRNV